MVDVHVLQWRHHHVHLPTICWFAMQSCRSSCVFTPKCFGQWSVKIFCWQSLVLCGMYSCYGVTYKLGPPVKVLPSHTRIVMSCLCIRCTNQAHGYLWLCNTCDMCSCVLFKVLCNCNHTAMMPYKIIILLDVLHCVELLCSYNDEDIYLFDTSHR